MTPSKQLRYTTAFFVVVFCIESISFSLEMNKVNPMPFDGYQLTPLLVSISSTLMSGVLLSLYFIRQKLILPAIAVIVLDGFNASVLFLNYLSMNDLYFNLEIADFVNALGFLILPLFCLTIVLSKARHFYWLNFYAILTLGLAVLNEILLFNNPIIDFTYLDYAFIFGNIFLILHLLFPDFKPKKFVYKDPQVIDDLQ